MQLMNFILLGVISSLLIGCGSAHVRSDRSAVEHGEGDLSSQEVTDEDLILPVPEIKNREQNLPVLGVVPTEDNAHVQKWIHYFQSRGRRHMNRYLARSTKYITLMKEILRENGLPEDLVYIALIESGFSSSAHSSASAVGYWQFIKGTAKRYGLEVSYYVDERRDPVLATEAAAKYLKGLYNVFGNWHLAMSSYNAGENRIKGAVMRQYTRDYWELVRRKKIPAETRNYVPKFIAAMRIAKNPEEYGFHHVPYEEPVQFKTIRIRHNTNLKVLARKAGIPYSTLKSLNQKFRRGVAVAGRRGGELHVPVNKVAAIRSALPKAKVNVRYVASKEFKTHRVRRGETLSGIAVAYGTSVRELRRINNFNRRSILRSGKKIRVPAYRGLAKASGSKSYQNYRVRRGDTLSQIARRFKVSMVKIRQVNRLDRRSTLRAGMNLKIPRNLQKKARRQLKKDLVYTVRRGDTLIDIARKYGVRLNVLTARNKLTRKSKLLVGRKLYIP